ncbi:MAG: hypothetical protein COU08_02915 [Candidatus Harrisonbacteria bacterium CG10_big_fil_rev_8_21_14_0_10_42_17]|uniref:Glycosyltransferase RgtA/B/C/D-like domain-containing protein n=1 Tax=Candidatus Harrisonbacteria bacterium CG10_big_fil_rev_8_21_14_0_10_42_17 TaxID=1974584 RepID=A0A2M6WHR6_9BACT|nr:MAG: hypothetical protein COU08_02915 [Candidatus Harrisonbacteria bacterium CG10_big_fil_rev_8_21_14_0_10_42_17]
MKRYLLLGILVTAAILRLWNVHQGDPLGDEVLYAFRAVGLVDFDEAEFQTTPLEWFDPSTSSGQVLESYVLNAGGEPIPAWTNVSFHDHPPLVFWIQHFFIKLLGENTFAFRLPSVIFGVLSVYVLYLLGTLLYSRSIGLLSAGILAVTLNHVFISRVGLQESYVIFFMLLASYYFVRALQRGKFFVFVGITLGLGLLTKFTIFILVPIFLTYLLFVRRGAFRSRFFWIGVFVAFALFSPVIYYNIQLYLAVGHFDFQFSFLFGQDPAIWQIAPGKDIGTISERISDFLPNLIGSHSWVFLLVVLSGFVAFLVSLALRGTSVLQRYGFMVLSFIWLFLMILVIGPGVRFLTMLMPFMALVVSMFLLSVERFFFMNRCGVVVGILGTLFLFEIFYSVNNQILPYPVGVTPWTVSEVRAVNANWGYNELDRYLRDELRGKLPAFTFDARYQFISDLQDESVERARARGLEPFAALIVYDGSIFNTAQLWTLDRLQVYHGWPVLSLDTYDSFLANEGSDFFERSGFKSLYYIQPTDAVLHRGDVSQTEAGKRFEQMLLDQGSTPLLLSNLRGDIAFRVYVL